MNSAEKANEQTLRILQDARNQGKVKNKNDVILLFAELSGAEITPEEFRAVRKFLAKVKRQHAATNRALRKADEQISVMGKILGLKPAADLAELVGQILVARQVHQKSALFQEGTRKKLEAEAARIREEHKRLEESINRFHKLTDAWNDFSEWARSQQS